MVCFEHDATTRHGTNDHSFLKLDYISADSRSLDHQMAAYSSATITNPFDDDADRNDLFLPCLGDAIFATHPIPPTTLTFFLKNKSEKFPPNCICWCYHGVDYWRILLRKWVIHKDDLANLSKLLWFCHPNPLKLDRHPHGGLMILPETNLRTFVEAITIFFFYFFIF